MRKYKLVNGVLVAPANQPTIVVNKTLEPYDVYIGRGSFWGNPFSHVPSTKAFWLVSTREEAIAKYREWILKQLTRLAGLVQLKGKRLGCYCAPLACHGDVLVELINKLSDEEPSSSSSPSMRSSTSTISAKVAHVKAQGQTRSHTCHWPGCSKQVPPALWGCKTHWYRLPQYLRDKIWRAYEVGQEISMTPSREYLDVAHEVEEWVETNANKQLALL